jgi:hypothetical protein
MWLPKDERRLLQGYFLKIGEVEKEKWFEITNWIPVMKSVRVKHAVPNVKEYVSGSAGNNYTGGNLNVANNHQYLTDNHRLDVANKALEQRELIKIHKHQSEPNVAAIALTISGYDLGRKYNSCWIRSGLWFAEYKDHWFWLIISFLGGIIGGVLVNWLSQNNQPIR